MTWGVNHENRTKLRTRFIPMRSDHHLNQRRRNDRLIREFLFFAGEIIIVQQGVTADGWPPLRRTPQSYPDSSLVFYTARQQATLTATPNAGRVSTNSTMRPSGFLVGHRDAAHAYQSEPSRSRSVGIRVLRLPSTAQASLRVRSSP